MAKSNPYAEFMDALRRAWRSEYPFIAPLSENRFYAGVAHPSLHHVFLYFQHSSKSWQSGQFTINVVLAKEQDQPRHWGFPTEVVPGQSWEGPRRIAHFLGQDSDKWWHLKDDSPPILAQAWRPSSYEDRSTVVLEAIEDVTRDVKVALTRLGIAELQALCDGPNKGVAPDRRNV